MLIILFVKVPRFTLPSVLVKMSFGSFARKIIQWSISFALRSLSGDQHADWSTLHRAVYSLDDAGGVYRLASTNTGRALAFTAGSFACLLHVPPWYHSLTECQTDGRNGYTQLCVSGKRTLTKYTPTLSHRTCKVYMRECYC